MARMQMNARDDVVKSITMELTPIEALVIKDALQWYITPLINVKECDKLVGHDLLHDYENIHIQPWEV